MNKLIVLIFCILSIGCASGQKLGVSYMIKETKEGGTVRLSGSNSWLEQGSLAHAERQIASKCPNGHEIVEKGLMSVPNVHTAGNSNEKYLTFVCKGE